MIPSPLKSPVSGVPLPKERLGIVPVWKLDPVDVANCQLPLLYVAMSVLPSPFQSPRSGTEALVPNPAIHGPAGESEQDVAQETVQLPVAGANLRRSVLASPLTSPAS